MSDRIPEFVKGATNVYRTKNFIVRQKACVTTAEKTMSCSATTRFSGGQPSAIGSTKYCFVGAGTRTGNGFPPRCTREFTSTDRVGNGREE